MKLRFLLFAWVAVLMFGVAAFANSVADPTIIIKDPICDGHCTQVPGTTFTFGVPNSGRGTLSFQNSSESNWLTLRLTETGVPAGAITCVQNVFANCSLGTLGNGKTFIFLSGLGKGMPGITTGEVFSITFGCTRGDCQPWPAGLDFTGMANLRSATVPEPTTVVLMMTGLAGIISRRRWVVRS